MSREKRQKREKPKSTMPVVGELAVLVRIFGGGGVSDQVRHAKALTLSTLMTIFLWFWGSLTS